MKLIVPVGVCHNGFSILDVYLDGVDGCGLLIGFPSDCSMVSDRGEPVPGYVRVEDEYWICNIIRDNGLVDRKKSEV